MKTKYRFLLLFCLLIPLCISAQPVEQIWLTQITDEPNVLSSNLHFFEGKIGVSMTDEDVLQSFLRVFDLEGDLLGDLPVQAIEYLNCSHYSDVDNHFYFGGTNTDSDSMIFSKCHCLALPFGEEL